MKSIQPVSVWYNGQDQQAVLLNAYVINDNLSTSANFYWALYTANSEQLLSQGNLLMDGQSYIDWNANPDINDAAYTWIADQLSLTII